MNRIDRRIAGTDAGIPGSGVCIPGDNGQNRGMLGGMSRLYSRHSKPRITNQTQVTNKKRNIEQFKNMVNSSNTNHKNNITITRIESKLENIEKSNALNIVGIHQKINVQETDIQLMKGDFKKQFSILKNYIKELENKIEKMNNREVLIAKKVEKVDDIEKVEVEVTKEIDNIKSSLNENNVTLEIVES
tara:strand:+ start:310 stop:876 length:567 start_codon:yes stop_codon:yes gene_type:complete